MHNIFSKSAALLRTSFILVAIFTLVFGVAYPLIITVASKILFASNAAGSLIVKDGAVKGSELIGQNFDAPGYFWGRPSATQPAYNASASAASNMSPGNPALAEAIKLRIGRLRAADSVNMLSVPVDLITASASGLDQHITPASAEYQVSRVAMARKLNMKQVRRFVMEATEDSQFGILGEPRVNVLKLNMMLDEEKK